METFPDTPRPARGSKGRLKPRVLSVQFGQGYAQESGDGPNCILREWPLIWSCNQQTLFALDAFLSARGGFEKFLWLPLEPFHSSGRLVFVCKEWEFIYEGFEVISLTATFLQRPVSGEIIVPPVEDPDLLTTEEGDHITTEDGEGIALNP